MKINYKEQKYYKLPILQILRNTSTIILAIIFHEKENYKKVIFIYLLKPSLKPQHALDSKFFNNNIYNK